MQISYLLILYRFLIGPILLIDAYDGSTGPLFVVGILSGFASDLLDGVIARRAGTVTAGLRELDGRVDVWFVAWISACAWLTYPDVIIENRLPLLIVILCQIVAWLVDLIKYHRFSNYHAYSAKAWGGTILVAFIFLFGFGHVGFTIWLVTLAGVICSLEEIMITIALPQWTYDVPSIFHALKLRKTSETSQFQVD